MVENQEPAAPDLSLVPALGEPHFSAACLVENVAVPPNATPADLKPVLRIVPRGTFAVAGLAVALLVLGWLLTFFFLFLPRGPIG